MFTKSVYRWNAVDVVGCDGLLHRGLVVNKVKSGLFIDFGIHSQAPTLFPYERVLRDLVPCPLAGNDSIKREDVLVLSQLAADQPWKWIFGQLLSQPTDEFSIVDYQSQSFRNRELLRPDRVRNRSSSRENVRLNDFIRDEVPIPDGFVGSEKFDTLWKEQFPFTHPVGVRGKRFVYIQSRNDKEIPLECSMALVGMSLNRASSYRYGIKRSLEDFLEDETLQTAKSTSSIRKIPSEILAEVFSILTIWTRAALRRVCRQFNAILTSAICSRTVIIDVDSCQNDHYKYACSLNSILTSRVWCLVFILDQGCECEKTPITLLHQLVTAIGIKVPVLIWWEIATSAKLLVDYSDMTLAPIFRSTCARLILKRLTIDEALDDAMYAHADVRIGYCAINTDEQCDFRNIFEKNCHEVKEEKELLHLSAWLKSLSKRPHFPDRAQVISVLKTWQHNDIRFGPNCSWKDVENSKLSKNLDTLRKTTLLALLGRKKEWLTAKLRVGMSDSSESSDSSSDSD